MSCLKKNKMKLILTITLCLLSVMQIKAQNPGDTIVVQTFVHDAYTDGNGNTTISLSSPRDTTAYFPVDTNLTFEKIIMSYNMRCKDNNNNNPGGTSRVGCGAYDYSCQTYVHDSTRIDSVLSIQASHSISSFNGSLYNYSISPVYNFYQYEQQVSNIDSTISEDSTSIGLGLDSLNFVISTEKNAHKSQFLYTADELNTLGLANDTIKAISLNILSGNETANFLSIKLKLTTDSILSSSSTHINGFTEVYNSNTLLTYGINRFQFVNDFIWDSVSNIIVEYSITNSTIGGVTNIEGEQTNNTVGLFSSDANHITVNSAQNIDLPTSAMNNITNELTVSFWINGNADILPQNTSIIEGYDSISQRTLNIHFPWSNGRMYWDCGNSGTSSYDRIDKAATLTEYTNEWSHWAFTKNALTGDQKIYRNGILWHSGTGHNRTIDIATLKLASNGGGNSNFWDGHIRELRIFDKELVSTTINDWMNKRINSSHPDYTNLVSHYPFNEGIGITSLDNTNNQQIASLNGNVNWNYVRGDKLINFFTETNYRPNIVFYQGQYTVNITTNTVLDSLIANPNTVIEHSIFSNYGTLQNDSIITVSTNNFWESLSYLFDSYGNILSIDTTNIDGVINISDMVYFKRYPMSFQIMSFVTPYGLGLDFGPQGKSWYFDVTDFSPILKGNKQITMSGGGQWQEDIDIKFLFIVGTPTRNVLDMQQIWRPQYKSYNAIIANDFFEPRDVLLNSDATAFKIRTTITGHGQEGEFVPQNHYVNIDGGNQEYLWSVWTECSENPVYPQGGTWIYDRAGWCPGQASDLIENEITSLVNPGQIHNIDYGVTSATGTSNYWVSNQLVSYEDPNHNLDAAVIDILSPTDQIKYLRTNPLCSKPKIVIQNTGSTTLTSLQINYWINNASVPQTYIWNGNLDFLEKEEVTLPDPNTLWTNLAIENNTFHVNIISPNNSSDEYFFNNSMTSNFESAPIYPSTFALWFQTNSGVINTLSQVSESSWEFLDNNETQIYNSGDLIANTQYRDTLIFDDGCYVFKVIDTDDDGIDFWANNDGGGMARFREIGASWLKSFEGDFGRSIHHEFRVENSLSNSEIGKNNISIFPNPATSQICVFGDLKKSSKINLSNNLGMIVKTTNINKASTTQKIDVSNLPKGIYILSIDNSKLIKKIVIQ